MIITSNFISSTADERLTQLWGRSVVGVSEPAGYLKLPISERIQWVCINVAELPTMNANGGSNGFGTLMSVYNLAPLSLRPTTIGRVATFAEQLGITKTGIFMN